MKVSQQEAWTINMLMTEPLYLIKISFSTYLGALPSLNMCEQHLNISLYLCGKALQILIISFIRNVKYHLLEILLQNPVRKDIWTKLNKTWRGDQAGIVNKGKGLSYCKHRLLDLVLIISFVPPRREYFTVYSTSIGTNGQLPNLSLEALCVYVCYRRNGSVRRVRSNWHKSHRRGGMEPGMRTNI